MHGVSGCVSYQATIHIKCCVAAIVCNLGMVYVHVGGFVRTNRVMEASKLSV